MIRFKLNETLKKQNRTPYWLAKQSGVRSNTIGQWVNHDSLPEEKRAKTITLDTLDKVCTALDCDLTDVIEFKKENSSRHS
ncbi:helix-turn-helix transcriptional regulator [Bacillus subtilis]|uniref:helix-turn-helix domain-containing protein n=1 Tax=Bacillus TaxID=1386 RepID=UPI00148F9142|nr:MULTISPECIES: helix-turn-helix transcriptional regulator [Bacillus]MBE0184916.1 helix-turn-helix transcriptional regulator [Bacillus subtilis]NOV04884.1 helix-turn-helix transcriptional regulator [Bacillus sp. seq1]CAF1814730.1 hypothetical protein NRS6085_03678 [Bacillus subtilis]CAI6306246.1 helix-turn-helix domain-containing protein [Bacillus subtilis]